MKTRKILSILLTLAMAIGLLALTPVIAHAEAPITVGNATELAAALSSAVNGDTIKLTADITYGTLINISGNAITFDLNGFTLNATRGLRVSGGKVLLADPANGEFNVTNSTSSFCVEAYGSDPQIEITSAAINSTAPTGGYAIYGNAGQIIVYGNVKQEKTGATAEDCGAWVMSGNITIEGEMTVSGGATYASFGPRNDTAINKTREQHTTPSTKPGYFTYTDGKGTIWVKDPNYVPPPAKGIFGTNARYQGWWAYLLFFVGFGFIWMWF